MTMFLENQINKMACVGVKTQSINTEFQKLYMDFIHNQEVSISSILHMQYCQKSGIIRVYT